MHGPLNFEEFLQQISGFLGGYYLAAALINALASLYLWQSGRARRFATFPVLGVPLTTSHVWLLV